MVMMMMMMTIDDEWVLSLSSVGFTQLLMIGR